MSVYSVAAAGLSAQTQIFAKQANAVVSYDDTPGQSANAMPVDRMSFSGQEFGFDDALVGMSSVKLAYAANAKIIKTQEEMDRSLLDIIS